MSELKKCPFCGHTGYKFEGDVVVSCSNPGCFYGNTMTFEQWQNRPIEDALQTKLDRALYLLQEFVDETEAEGCPKMHRCTASLAREILPLRTDLEDEDE